MMNQTKVSPIEQIREEFMQRWGVEIDIDISVHSHINPKVNKGLAEEIVSAYCRKPAFLSNDEGTLKWTSNKEIWTKESSTFSLSVFYTDKEEIQ
jgi:hypothetical protein